MNYQLSIKQEYNYNLPSSASPTTFCFFADGSGVTITDISVDDTIYQYLGQLSNLVNREYNDRGGLIGCEYFTSGISYSFFTNKCDYIVHGGGYLYQGLHMDDAITDDLGDLVGYQNYPSQMGSGYMTFSSFTYGYYAGQVQQQLAVLDYTAFKYEGQENDINAYRTDIVAIPGENMAFYKTCLRKVSFSQQSCYLAYGSPISDTYNTAWRDGYSDGYSGGYVQGVGDGYQQGVTSIGGNIGSQQATAFSYIGNAFGAVGNIMSLEILPNVTLGLCFSIPMVFVLIMTIFKLVRK